MTLVKSWVSSANEAHTPFPLNNLPYGVFSFPGAAPRCGVAIGDFVLDMRSVEAAGLLRGFNQSVCQQACWNDLMALGASQWRNFRQILSELLIETSPHQQRLQDWLYPLERITLHMPFTVSEFTDFYAGRHHATNVGTMFRGVENALPPNWLHIPIGYNGRASSVVVSGTDIVRPWGQLKSQDKPSPAFLPSRRFDFELEMGAVIGSSSNRPVSVDEADAMIFGYVLLNDWSARDIQAWEYQPLGPFQAKATATTISPWIVTAEALEPFRVHTPERECELLPHLQDTGPMLFDIDLHVQLEYTGASGSTHSSTIASTNYREMYYSAAQQLAHHASSGCPMRTGDLLGSGTISGPERHQRGSMLELSWGGKEPVYLDDGVQRSFLEDGDTVTFTGSASNQAYTIGFGSCIGTVQPAMTG